MRYLNIGLLTLLPLFACSCCRSATVETQTIIEHKLDANGQEIEIKTCRGEIKY